MSAGHPDLSDRALSVWGKTDRTGTAPVGWLPLWRHLADTADVAGRLWDLWLSPAVRRVVNAEVVDARTLLVWLAGIHDIGKATPAFAHQAPQFAERMRERGLDYHTGLVQADRRFAPHAAAGHVILADWLDQQGWSDPHPHAVVVGGHHGVPPTDELLRGIHTRRYLLGDPAWTQVQQELLHWMAQRSGAGDRLAGWRDAPLSQPVQAALTGLVIVADWIASNHEYFPYTLDLSDADRLTVGWDELDLPEPWQPAMPASSVDVLFAARFTLPAGATTRPVQRLVAERAESMPTAGMLIVEAAMGEGKTEAALAAVEILARRTGAAGCYLALPTRATSDAMFGRMLDWLRRLPDAGPGAGSRDVRLAHGKAAFNPDYDRLRRVPLPSAIAQDAGGADIAVHEWFAGRKRTLLSNFVVGTVDQLLFAALRGKHLVLRHLGLAGKVVIVDEVHAYDVFMSRFLDRALEWLGAYGVPVVVLSATLPASRRAALMNAYDNGRLGPPPAPTWRDRGKPASDPYAPLRGDMRYPLVTVSGEQRGAEAVTCADSGRRTRVQLHRLDDDITALATLLQDRLSDGGCALIVRNTVARVQETADALRAEFGPGTPVTVAHSRFMAVDRAAKDRWLSTTFGPTGERPTLHVVVASQVAEQSLDIDFDLLVTDLAPVDLILQRIGRLHRHQRDNRPAKLANATCWVTGADWSTEPPQPNAGSRRVYQLSTLLRSAAVLTPYLDGTALRLPADISPLTQAAYGDTPVGPPAWQPTMAEADVRQRDEHAAKEQKADGFRLAAVGGSGSNLINWVSGGIGEAEERAAQGYVRDTDTESLEVLLLVRTADGLAVPPWVEGGGAAVPTASVPGGRLPRQIARCTLPLPRMMTDPEAIDDVIAELEARHDLTAWQQSPWLAGELLLDVDHHGRASVGAFDLHYDPHEGLRVTRNGAP